VSDEPERAHPDATPAETTRPETTHLETTRSEESHPDSANHVQPRSDATYPEHTTEPFAETTDDGETEKEWWDDPRMPWKGKPGRADMVCWIGIAVIGIYGLVMMPLRAYLVVHNPVLQAALTGSRSALVVLGVTGNPLWWLGLILGTISIVKFDWIYFLAGRLWGRGLIELMAGRSKRAARNADRAERLARRWGVPAVLITYLPIPIPAAVIYATVAMAGMSWKKFWVVNIIGAVVIQCTWVGLGFWLGEPARKVVEAYANISMYVAFAILIGVFAGVFLQRRKAATRSH
jgi:membrane protein DedA with SNARE-associated domain